MRDLKGRHVELTCWQNGPLKDMQMPWQCSLYEELDYINRIIYLEEELENSRKEVQRYKIEKMSKIC